VRHNDAREVAGMTLTLLLEILLAAHLQDWCGQVHAAACAAAWLKHALIAAVAGCALAGTVWASPRCCVRCCLAHTCPHRCCCRCALAGTVWASQRCCVRCCLAQTCPHRCCCWLSTCRNGVGKSTLLRALLLGSNLPSSLLLLAAHLQERCGQVNAAACAAAWIKHSLFLLLLLPSVCLQEWCGQVNTAACVGQPQPGGLPPLGDLHAC
jgi:hypothetical protein